MLQLVTVSGANGSGTTMLSHYLAEHCGFNSIETYTTRSRLPHGASLREFVCVSNQEFERRRIEGEFLLTTSTYGTSYGVLRRSIGKAFIRQDGPSFINIPFEWVDEIAVFAGYTAPRLMASIYLLSPKQQVLQGRLRERGDSFEKIKERIRQSILGDQRAQSPRDLHIEFLSNDGTPEELFAKTRIVLDLPKS